MSGTAPPIDRRAAGDVARQIEALLRVYAPAWDESDPETGRATGISAALIGIAARFAELTIQRLNQAPDKNLLAFLDMLGASPLPPQPARVPLTFSLATGATGAVVPARTQVAAPPGPNAKAPVLFETETELALTPAGLSRVMTGMLRRICWPIMALWRIHVTIRWPHRTAATHKSFTCWASSSIHCWASARSVI